MDWCTVTLLVLTTEICNDGRDNDGDGKIDVEDLDCPAVPEICNNLLDDDGDGFKDAEDLNSCPAVPEICNNLLDDDRDGFIDAADEDCLTGYHYAPFFTATGSNRVDVPDAQNLRLSYLDLLLLHGLKQQATSLMKELW